MTAPQPREGTVDACNAPHPVSGLSEPVDGAVADIGRPWWPEKLRYLHCDTPVLARDLEARFARHRRWMAWTVDHPTADGRHVPAVFGEYATLGDVVEPGNPVAADITDVLADVFDMDPQEATL